MAPTVKVKDGQSANGTGGTCPSRHIVARTQQVVTNMKAKLRRKPYSYNDVLDAIESSARWAVRRAYKHRNDPQPSEEIINQIGELAAQDAMNDLCEMIDFGE